MSDSDHILDATRPPLDVIAAAAERRTQQDTHLSGAQLLQEHDQRQMFRRLIDPGIFRPNSKEVAFVSLKTLLTLAENLLREPDNLKFQQFKATNDTIRRRLIEPKGTLEYAIALGFRPDVKEFQPIYVFNPRKMAELRMGAAILREAVDLESQKQERAQRSKKEEKAAIEAAAQNVKLAFLDDRMTKKMRDQRERQHRESRKDDGPMSPLTPIQASSPSPSVDLQTEMPGVGQTLTSSDRNVDSPPPYND
ncbi:hypothetical protein SERLA73DRAFT_132602 [Serpula lacrymans var. lacrymans S7.3]|uniref:PUB domain-containing protein n=1 Tax=Serpula lacrymans var. lacrymans (strain S7.3) TaxID=936435 RepID=F8PP49_SERL3|nr:hypothetical protein SERLA73DRAFT_132602 [Serpula lacrymans var. lacrymans S7.3]